MKLTLPPDLSNVAEENAFLAQVNTACHRFEGRVRRTRLMPSMLGGPLSKVLLKLECEQVSGSCKIRSAYNNVLALLDREPATKTLFTVSTGNNGIATAYVARELGLECIVFVPENITSFKVEKMASLGARLERHGTDIVETEISGRRYAQENGLAFLSPYNSWEAVWGQATIAVEIVEQCEERGQEIGAVVVPVGGGGLIAGIGAMLKRAHPEAKVFGVCPRHSAVLMDSVRAGTLVHYESLPTLSDATAGGVEADSVTLPLCHQHVDDFIAVDECQIGTAMATLKNIHNVPVEGAGALAVAAYLARPELFEDLNTVLLACGSNIAPKVLESVCERYSPCE